VNACFAPKGQVRARFGRETGLKQMKQKIGQSGILVKRLLGK
jgi:hypothetical protein